MASRIHRRALVVHSLLSVNQKVFDRRAIACAKSTVRDCQEQAHVLLIKH
ncbi:hypothetical protein [Nostoc sp.]